MTYNGNGAYANEWLIGDVKTGEICSLQLGCYHWDIYRTFDGFIGSCNYPKGESVREETTYDWTDSTTSGYCRYQRWLQLNETYYGQIDVELAKKMIADHYDVLTGKENPCHRTICGHGEIHRNGTTILKALMMARLPPVPLLRKIWVCGADGVIHAVHLSTLKSS